MAAWCRRRLPPSSWPRSATGHAALLAAGITLAGVLIFHVGLKMSFDLFTWH